MIDPAAKLDDWPWGGPGLDLNELPVTPHPWKRIVACLNVWNDVEELKQSLPRWIDHVDAVFAIDGEYGGSRRGSDDGTLEYLRPIPKVEITRGSWATQPEKRGAYFAAGRPGDLLWIIDADEYVTNPACLRQTPYLDVGWVRCASPLYNRPQHQPRLFRWREGLKYAGRHHWVYAGERLIASHQEGGRGLIHRSVPLGFLNSRGAIRPEARALQSEVRRIKQVKEESGVGKQVEAHEPLRIFQSGPFDPGGVMSRLHTAINTTSPHESAMAPNGAHPFGYPQQYDLTANRLLCRDLAWTADIVHHHATYAAWDTLNVPLNVKWNVIHHHGTELRKFHDELYNIIDPARAGLRLVSNLELLQYGEHLNYLPNPVAFARYAAIPRNRPKRPKRFRVGHSPSKQEIKGTASFLAAVEKLRRQGIPIEPVVIHDKSIRECLEIKATCDLFFDSFWLGLQCSGLEAACMGMPVIAGDPDCKRGYEKWLGATPYTYANSQEELTAVLERFCNDRIYRENEAARVRSYVLEHHDGAAVVQKYLELLDTAFGWREHLRLKAA